MTSEQKKTDADSKKQSNESSATMEIFADDDVDKKNNKKQEPPQRNMKPVNSNILADASNKSEMQQEQLPQQAFYKKKKGYQKKKGFQKKKFENKNKTLWNPNNKNTGTTDDRHQNWNNKSNARNHYYPDDYHHGRNNHQDYLRYEEANMAVNQNVSTGFQPVPPFSRYIRGSDHTFPVPHPQQQKHLFADDGNNKVLLEQNSNGSLVYSDDRDHVVNHNGSFNGTEYSSWSQSPLSRHSWVNMLENNTQIECVVLKRGGESMLVPIPPNVGACLVQELLVQKESFMASAQQRSDPKAYTNIETDQGRPAEGNVGTSGVGDQGRAPSSSFANHQASSVVEHGGAYPMVNTPGHPHCRSYHHQGHNNHTDPNLHYEVYVPTLNPQQPYNGYGSFPPVGVSSIQCFGIEFHQFSYFQIPNGVLNFFRNVSYFHYYLTTRTTVKCIWATQ